MVAKERKRDSNLVGVAVLGTGRIGGSYIDVVNQTPGAVLKVVAEQRAEAAAPWEDKYPDVEFVSDYKAVLERDDVDIVIGTLPHWLHYEAGLDAAEAGKNVFMEKPLALTSLEGREVDDCSHPAILSGGSGDEEASRFETAGRTSDGARYVAQALPAVDSTAVDAYRLQGWRNGSDGRNSRDR